MHKHKRERWGEGQQRVSSAQHLARQASSTIWFGPDGSGLQDTLLPHFSTGQRASAQERHAASAVESFALCVGLVQGGLQCVLPCCCVPRHQAVPSAPHDVWSEVRWQPRSPLILMQEDLWGQQVAKLIKLLRCQVSRSWRAAGGRCGAWSWRQRAGRRIADGQVCQPVCTCELGLGQGERGCAGPLNCRSNSPCLTHALTHGGVNFLLLAVHIRPDKQQAADQLQGQSSCGTPERCHLADLRAAAKWLLSLTRRELGLSSTNLPTKERRPLCIQLAYAVLEAARHAICWHMRWARDLAFHPPGVWRVCSISSWHRSTPGAIEAT